MTSLQHILLAMLADGNFHSGQILAEKAGVSRSAIWKALQNMRESGLEVRAIRGRGYQLEREYELLDREKIHDKLSPNGKHIFSEITVLPSVDSTNTWLQKNAVKGKTHVCIVETQTGGKGRRSKCWFSPLSGNLYLSLAYSFNAGASGLSGLSLVVALAIVSVLEREGVRGLRIKWPNDVYTEGRKLAGILVEISGEANGPCQAIIGIGINFRLPASVASGIDQPCIDLFSMDVALSRNRIAALILDELAVTLGILDVQGFSVFVDAWMQYDYLRDKDICLQQGDVLLYGIARGIAGNGYLLVEQGGETTAIGFGEISVRKQGVVE